MSYATAKGGTIQSDDQLDPLVPGESVVPLDNDSVGSEADHNVALFPCPEVEGSVFDDSEVEDSHMTITVEEVFDEDPSVLDNFPDGPLGVGNNDASCDNNSDVSVNIVEEINAQEVDKDTLGSCSVNRETEERMVEEEVNLEGENEYEAPIQIGVCGENEVPEMSEYEKLRERNIREREEMMKEVMEDINEAKQEMYDNAPKRKLAVRHFHSSA